MPESKPAFRVDRGTRASKAEVTPQGFLKCDAYITRTGVFEYALPNGQRQRELRLAEDVFSEDALKSFAMLPLTDDHPPVAITADNAKQYQVGHLSETVEREGDLVKAKALITDAKTIDKVTSREKVEISCGYTCDLEFTAGEYEGMKYDAIQKNIRGNHVAIVKQGRAGPLARLKLDGAGEMINQENTMILKFDGVDFEVAENVAKAIETERAKRDADAAKAKEDLDKASARADAAAAEVEKLKGELAAAPEKIRAEIKARVELETKARKILGAEAKFDGKDDATVKAEAVKAMHPELDLAGKSPAYVEARFDIACELAEKEGSANEQFRDGVNHSDSSDDKDSAEAARLKMLERNAKLYAGK